MTGDDFDMGLSSSEVDYLNSTTRRVQNVIAETTANSDNVATCENNIGAISDLVVSNNKSSSADLPDTITPVPIPMDISQTSVQAKLVSSNELVQVAMQGALDVINPAPMQMVGYNNVNSILTVNETSPTINNNLTDMIDVTNLFQVPDGTILGSNSGENLQVLNIVQCQSDGQNQFQGTDNNGQMYFLTMTVEDDTSMPVKDEDKVLSVMDEPQCASTPKPLKDDESEFPDETILAGNLDACSNKVKEDKEEKVVQEDKEENVVQEDKEENVVQEDKEENVVQCRSRRET